MGKKLPPEEYDKARARLEEKYDYEHMSDEKKAQFDASFEEVYGKKEDSDETDEADQTEELEGMEPERNGRGRDDDDEDVR